MFFVFLALAIAAGMFIEFILRSVLIYCYNKWALKRIREQQEAYMEKMRLALADKTFDTAIDEVRDKPLTIN